MTTKSILLAILLCLFCFGNFSTSSEKETYNRKIEKISFECKGELIHIPKELEGKYWNRWTSKNFTVLAINDEQAKYLYDHLEHIKSWILTRWGFYDIDFSAECMVIAVDEYDLFRKMFRINGTLVEVRRDKDGRIDKSILFLLFNKKPSDSIPQYLTEIALSEFEQKYNANFGVWTHRGMSLLNMPVDKIKFHFSELRRAYVNDDPLYFANSLFEMNKDDYDKLTDDDKLLFDRCAACLLLMIRKEFGEHKLHLFLKSYSDGKWRHGVNNVLKFESVDELNYAMKRFMDDLTREVSEGKTPNSYLQITPVAQTISNNIYND